MPVPSPFILIHSLGDAPDNTVKRLGLDAESASEPILLRRVRASATLFTDRIEDYYGDLAAEAWGNRSLEYQVDLEQLAQYGASDHYLGRFDGTLLANLSVNFGLSTASGTALLTQASREMTPAKVAAVSLTIRVEDTRHGGFGSPDGPSTPVYGGTPAGTRPSITSIATATGTIGSAFSYDGIATGTPPITWAMAPGVTLPPNLVLNASTGDITGTPTGLPSDNYLEIRASNGYGTTSFILHITIAAAAVPPPAPVQTYVRYLVDSNQATVPDGFWTRSYSGMSPAPTNQASFLAGTPGSSVGTATDPGTPTNPNALSDSIGGTRLWNITEILGRNPTSGVYEHWYQRSPADTVLMQAHQAGRDVVAAGTTELVTGEDIGVSGPGDPAAPAWPGEIAPTDRITQYYRYRDSVTDETWCGGLGGDKVYPDLVHFRAAFPSLVLNESEGHLILLEVYNKSGAADLADYLFQADSADDTAIYDALAASQSPIYHAAQHAGLIQTSIPDATPAFALLDLPTPPATSTGDPVPADAWLFVLIQLWGDGSLQCWGLRANVPDYFFLDRLLQLYRLPVARPDPPPLKHDELTVGRNWVKEVWARLPGVATNAWKCYWLDPTYASAADSLIGKSLADNVNPVNNPLVAPGVLFADATVVW